MILVALRIQSIKLINNNIKSFTEICGLLLSYTTLIVLL